MECQFDKLEGLSHIIHVACEIILKVNELIKFMNPKLYFFEENEAPSAILMELKQTSGK